LRESTDLVECDLQRFYGVDLAAYYRGELSLRRLSVLLAGLPDGSATWAARNGIDPGWDVRALLLADVFHALSGHAHPARPAPKKQSRYASARARLEAQRARLAADSPAQT
jgi:hypothetical protein